MTRGFLCIALVAGLLAGCSRPYSTSRAATDEILYSVAPIDGPRWFEDR